MNFDLAKTPMHKGVSRLEASAGTGKTFALAGLFLRLLLEQKVSARDILVVTFTEAATAELRDRIRKRLTEALAVLQGSPTQDPLLLHLAGQVQPRLSAAIQALRHALEVFDLVSIYTIHSFCQRTLQDAAFESGILFDLELVTDQDDLIREVAADYCRGQLHGSEIVVASAALQAKLNPDTLSRLLRQFVTYPELKLEPAKASRPADAIAGEIRAGFERFVAAWQSLSGGRRGLVNYFVATQKWAIGDHADEAIIDVRAEVLERCQDAATLSEEFWEAVRFFSTSAVQADIRRGKQMPPECPDLFDACEQLAGLVAEFATAHRLRFLRGAVELLANRKQEAKQQSYDDLITRLAKALEGSSGPLLAGTIRRRYRAALIDESQDTDPLQWRIFHAAFGSSTDHWLYLIGDPKQAIYGFRGADVDTYLKAAETASYQYSLGTNWRSESALVQAVNALFSSAGESTAFVEEKIRFEAVQPGPKADEDPIRFPPPDERPAPFQVWSWEPQGTTVTSKTAQSQLPLTVAAEISRLLRTKALLGQGRVIQPGDVAVLVESHRQARWIQGALHDLGIPSVEQAMESVFESDEARELHWILTGVLVPGREAWVKTALTTDAFGLSGTALQAMAAVESQWQACLRRFACYRQRWEEEGFFCMFVQLLRQERVIENLLRFPDAERRITNFLHLAELLGAAGQVGHLGPARLVQWLEERRNGHEAAPDEYQLRLESDDVAVKIVTIHRSKGLQYPVVFCPFVSKDAALRQIRDAGRKVMDVVLYHDGASGNLSWDIGTAPNPSNRRLAGNEQLAEKVRLLYVALTRACNRCYLVSARYASNKSTALAWLLRTPGPMPENPVAALDESPVQPGEWKARWRQIAATAAANCGGKPAIAIDDLPTSQGERWARDNLASSELKERACKRAIEPAWRVSSFTNLAGQLTFRSAADEQGALPDHDEMTTVASPAAPADQTREEPAGIFALPAGARTGDCLHKILERFDFSDPDEAGARSLADQQLQACGLGNDSYAVAIAEMLGCLRQLPLDPKQPGLTLARIPARQRLTEMEFHFPAPRFEARQLLELIRATEATPTSADCLSSARIAVFLKGFIDLVFVFEGRYHVIDWKSNLLGPRAADYTQQAMKTEVEKHYYDLQYHIYTVALDRFLHQRMAGYDYELHFGGVHYVFLRGLDAARPELGVHHARPSREMLGRLSTLLGTPVEVLQ